MQFHIPDNYNFFNIGFQLYVANTLRYVIIAGFAFVIFYWWKKNNFQHKRIQKRIPQNKDYLREFFYSLTTFIIFSFLLS